MHNIQYILSICHYPRHSTLSDSVQIRIWILSIIWRRFGLPAIIDQKFKGFIDSTNCCLPKIRRSKGELFNGALTLAVLSATSSLKCAFHSRIPSSQQALLSCFITNPRASRPQTWHLAFGLNFVRTFGLLMTAHHSTAHDSTAYESAVHDSAARSQPLMTTNHLKQLLITTIYDEFQGRSRRVRLTGGTAR